MALYPTPPNLGVVPSTNSPWSFCISTFAHEKLRELGPLPETNMTSHLKIHLPKVKNSSLVGGFNPVEKYLSKWESSPGRGENKTYLKPPRSSLTTIPFQFAIFSFSQVYISTPLEVQFYITNPYIQGYQHLEDHPN